MPLTDLIQTRPGAGRAVVENLVHAGGEAPMHAHTRGHETV